MMASFNDLPLPIRSSPALYDLTPPSRRRATAIARSRSVSRVLVAGKSRRMNDAMPAQTMVATPSMIKSLVFVSQGWTRFKVHAAYHRHPRKPPVPSMPPVMAPARRPPKHPDKMAADMYTPKRLDCSSRLYQDEMMSRIPGATLQSADEYKKAC